MKAMIRISTDAANALAWDDHELYVLHDDGSESLLDLKDMADFDETLQYGIEGEIFGEPYEDSK